MGDEVIGTYQTVYPFPSSRKRVIKCGECSGLRVEVTFSFIMGMAIMQTDDELLKRREEVALANSKLDEVVNSARSCSCVRSFEGRRGE